MSEHPNNVQINQIPLDTAQPWDTQKVWFVGAGRVTKS